MIYEYFEQRSAEMCCCSQNKISVANVSYRFGYKWVLLVHYTTFYFEIFLLNS